MERVIFQASDLAKERVKVLDAARAGRALVRDKDGTGLVMLREQYFDVIEGFATWSQALQRLNVLIATDREVSVAELGEFAWLRVFDKEDQKAFSDELYEALIAGLADQDLSPLTEVIGDWRTTARQLEDPLRRSVLLGATAPEDFVEVEEPSE